VVFSWEGEAFDEQRNRGIFMVFSFRLEARQIKANKAEIIDSSDHYCLTTLKCLRSVELCKAQFFAFSIV